MLRVQSDPATEAKAVHIRHYTALSGMVSVGPVESAIRNVSVIAPSRISSPSDKRTGLREPAANQASESDFQTTTQHIYHSTTMPGAVKVNVVHNPQ
jgi:hypothetical protein